MLLLYSNQLPTASLYSRLWRSILSEGEGEDLKLKTHALKYQICPCTKRHHSSWKIVESDSGHKGQNELMVEIYSKSLVRPIGKVLLIKFS